LFLGLVVIQLAVPGWMIGKRELTLHRGEQFRFRTAPVDPYDPFRGRYVALAVDAATFRGAREEGLLERQRVSARLIEDEEGFARFAELSAGPATDGSHLWVKIRRTREDEFTLDLPFDRYYLDERLAPEAEKAYREHAVGDKRAAYITVRVWRGNAVLEELFIEDLPVLEFIRRQEIRESAE
jgi:uncharacterized membrane-anchored protein